MAVQKAKVVPVIPAEIIPDPAAPSPNTPGQAALTKANDTPNSHLAANTETVDSVGKPKEGGTPAKLGPRGFNAPRDAKPAPAKKADQTKITVTEKKDSAGNEKVGHGETHTVGIRGTHSTRDTYRL